MEKVPTELKYTKTHEWLRVDKEEGLVIVGITDHAQALLGDLVYVELPEPGLIVSMGDESGVVESVKAASDIYAPIAGEVVFVNQALESTPELINRDPYGDGWIFKIALSSEADLDALLDAEAYSELLETE